MFSFHWNHLKAALHVLRHLSETVHNLLGGSIGIAANFVSQRPIKGNANFFEEFWLLFMLGGVR